MTRATTRWAGTEAILRGQDLTLHEWFVLSLIGTWPVAEAAVAPTAASLSDGDPRGTMTLAQARRAVKSCRARDLVTVVTQPYLDMIRLGLERDPLPGPFAGLPKVGEVDFTPHGALNVFLPLRRQFFPNYPQPRPFPVEGEQPGFIFTDLTEVLQFARRNEAEKPPLRLALPRPLGRWRRYWWDEYENGLFVGLVHA